MGLLLEIENLSIAQQSDLHNILRDHLMAIGILEPPILTEDQQIILDDTIESYEKEGCKGIPWEEVKEGLKKKYPDLTSNDSPPDMLSPELIGKVLELPTQEQIELFEYLQPAADASFQQMLLEMNMTEEQWDKMHDEMYIHFSAMYKKKADEIRRQKGLK